MSRSFQISWAIAGAVASLAAGIHVSREVRATMHLHADAYEARCRRCYDPTEAEQPSLDITADAVSG